MKKNYLYLVVIAVFLIPINVFAENTIINGNDFSIYQRSKEDIKNKWETGVLEIPTSIYEIEPSYETPYQAGVVKEGYLKEVMDNLNYYRYLTGTPEITEIPKNNEDLQTAEVLQYLYYKSTNDIEHDLYNYFEKPTDMNDDFYNKGVYARHNIISTYGYKNPIFPFFNESEFTTTAGHRTILLRPEVDYMEYGLGKTVYGVARGNLNQYDKMTNNFAAYPSPGYFPKQDFNGDSDWDIYLNENKFKALTATEKNNVQVTIKDNKTGIEYTRSISEQNLTFYDENIILIAQPEKTTTYYENEYTVTVTNLKDIENNLIDITYTVTFYDKFEGIESNVNKTMFDMYFSGVHFDGDYNEKLIKESLEDIGINISLESGAFIHQDIEDYSITKQATYQDEDTLYYAKPIINNIPDWIIDSNNIINNSKIRIYGHNKEENLRYTYEDTIYTKQKDEEVTLSIKEFKSDYDGDAIYMWVKEKNNTFSLLEDKEKYSTDGLNLTIKNLTKEDEGNYYLVTFLMPNRYYNTYYYLSKPISLSVKNEPKSIEFNSDTLKIVINKTTKLTPIINPEDAETTLTWKSNNPNIVSVDQEGNIQALSKGTATITVTTDNNLSASIKITVNELIKGDMNKDGTINFGDVIIALRKYLNIDETTEEDIEIGDMNTTGQIEFGDIITILRIYLGIN